MRRRSFTVTKRVTGFPLRRGGESRYEIRFSISARNVPESTFAAILSPKNGFRWTLAPINALVVDPIAGNKIIEE